MKVKEVKKREVWKGFLQDFKEKTFLQSWNWGEFQKEMGKKVWRLGVFEGKTLLGLSLVFKEEARRGAHLVVPHGPMIKSQRKQVFDCLLERVKRVAREEGAAFIRVAPIWRREERNKEIFEEEDLREAPIHIHPEVTWQLDLEPSEKEILMGMRKNTRYYVRKARENEKIEVKRSRGLEDLNTFNRLYRKTAERHDFTPFSGEYIEKEFRTFLPDDEVLIFLGLYEGKVVVASIVLFWQGIAFYHQGASEPVKPPVSYGVQWEIIREAKRRDCQGYNFWGVADIDLHREEAKEHPWWGLTLFKRGFGGKTVRYLKTRDLPLSPFYALNYVVERIRSKRRGFG